MESNTRPKGLRAGIGRCDISPRKPLFLCGYPHVARTSTGIHDPLFASAFYLANGRTELLTISLDLAFFNHRQAGNWRAGIERATGIPTGHILISATHTHSGPVLAEMLASSGDPVVPPPDPDYLELVRRGVVEAATTAKRRALPAALAVTGAHSEGVGGNRLDPRGPRDPEVRRLNE